MDKQAARVAQLGAELQELLDRAGAERLARGPGVFIRSPVLDRWTMAKAMAKAAELYELDPRDGAMFQLLLLGEYAASTVDLPQENLSPVRAIAEAIYFAEWGKKHPLFEPKKEYGEDGNQLGGKRPMDVELINTCLAVDSLLAAKYSLDDACEQVAARLGKTAAQVKQNRKDFTSRSKPKIGTKEMRELYHQQKRASANADPESAAQAWLRMLTKVE